VLVEVGAAENHTDLNKALIDMAPGEHKDVTLVYEDKHPTEGLAGKTVQYSLSLKGVKDKVVPAADDEFAKDLGQFDSLQELRADIKKQLTSAEEKKIDREVKGRIVEGLLQRASFEVPEALVERHMNARMENAVRSLAMQGVDPRTTGIDWKEYRESQRTESREAARADILLDALARKEKVEVTEEEVDAELERYAERVRKPKEAVRAKMEKEGDLAGLRARIREDKTLDLLKANARMEFE
jgi:trigger factor